MTLLLCFAGVGCVGYDGSDASFPGTRRCQPATYSCSIEDAACASAILAVTACERGDVVPTLPTIQRYTPSEFGELSRRKLEEAGLDQSPWDPVLRALGLLPMSEGLTDAMVNQAVEAVAAFYDDETKSIGVITAAGSGSADVRERMYTLSHELTHYLQDLEHDLQKLHDEADTTDQQMALSMLVEGEATANSTRVLLDIARANASRFSYQSFFDMLEASILQSIVAAPSPLAAALQGLPYPVGGRYVHRLWDIGGRGAVDALFEHAPPTTAKWIATNTLVEASAPDERLGCAPPLPPAGFEVYQLDQFGAAGVVAMLGSIDMMDLALASDLVEDAIAVYVQQGAPDPASAPVIGVWRLRFHSPVSSERFAALFESRGLGLQRVGSELLLRVSSDPSLAPWQPGELEACPSFSELAPMQPGLMPPSAALKRLFNGQLLAR